ncbi:PhoH family protein [Oribacterium sp. oral taxon 108]|uniref:PhoH family protein n=1 Tax=Oribacterium sp. oral taxon 108 TaxID=712414 RepID=UPI00020DDB91|nr:PhoH family protein [Oribacterium sp. oral taxon 108]EGL37127.1 PhoH family protein [Oribacterium sp. oral taxon 108 str. F0425]
MAEKELILDIPLEHEMNILGDMDKYLRKLQRQFSVNIIDRDGLLKIIGEEENAEKTKEVLLSLLKLSEKGNRISEQNVDYAISLTIKEGKAEQLLQLEEDFVARTALGKPVKPKTLGQKSYVDKIRKNMITFGVGPAGTGKTYLAMAMAITAFREEEVSRIILTRPAIEAGEKLGFLPGDLQSKVDPYLRPLYDALYNIMGPEQYLANAEKGLIEVAPLAYMRGRTLDNAYIILDEAQNTTPAQMKMFLTRIGFGSKVIVTGDLTQKDLEEGKRSGLEDAMFILKNVEGIAFSELTSEDVVRHPLVQRIVNAYEKDEERKKRENHANRHRVGSRERNKRSV